MRRVAVELIVMVTMKMMKMNISQNEVKEGE